MSKFALLRSLQKARLEPLYLDWTVTLKRPPNILAHEYWQSRRADKAFPPRANIRPGDMRKFVTHVGLIDIQRNQDKVDYFIRHAGSEWEAVFGSMRGRYIHEFLPPEIEARWRMLLDSVLTGAKPVRATTRIGFQDKSWLLTEMFVGPLGEDGVVTTLFMCFTSWTDYGTGVHR